MSRSAGPAALVLWLGATARAAAPGSDEEPPAGQPRVLRTDSTPQKNVKPPPEMEIFEPPKPPPPPKRRAREGPDEQPLWRLLREGQYAAVLDGIAQLRAKYPSWSPPEELLALIEEGQTHQQVEDIIRRGRANEIFELAKAHPDLFDCAHVDHLWALAKAHASAGHKGDTIRVYVQVAKTCPRDPDKIAAIYEAKPLLRRDEFAALVNGGEVTMRSPAGKKRLAQIRYEMATEAIAAAYERKDYPRAARDVEGQSAEIVTRRDAATATLGGWSYYHQEDWGASERWLQRALDWQPDSREARYLMALTWFRTGRLDQARTTALALPQEDSRRRGLLGDVEMGLARRSYDAKDYAGALSHLSEAEALGADPVEVGRLRAWSRYNSGEYEAAAAEFTALYKVSPDDDLAEGIVQASLQTGKRDRALALGKKMGGPLERRTREFRSAALRDEKLFVAASAAAPEDDPQAGLLSPRLSLYSAFRRKEAGGGLANLDLFKFVMIEGTVYPAGTHEIQFRVDGMRLRSGDLGENAFLGRYVFGTPYVEPPRTEESVWEPRLGWRHEGERVTPFAEVGTTPLGASIAPRPTWRLGARVGIPRGAVEGQFRGQPVRDSLLSYTGTVDPYSGQKWGRVYNAGVSVWGYAAPARYVTTAWRGVTDRLYGQDVQTNTRIGIGGSGGLAARFKGVDQLSIGPYLDLDRYEHNVGGTTFGHGGYFSPRLFVRSGIYADLLTAEMRRFMVKARVSVGLAYKETDFTPFFPLEVNPGGEYVAEKESDLDYSGELLAGVALGRHLQLGGAFSIRRSRVQSLAQAAGGLGVRVDYNDVTGLVVLRGSWEARPFLVSRDLPSAALSDMYSATGWP